MLAAIVGTLSLALLCAACADVEHVDRRAPAPADSAGDSVSSAARPPAGKPTPFDSSYEHSIRTVPEDNLDSAPMPKTPQ